MEHKYDKDMDTVYAVLQKLGEDIVGKWQLTILGLLYVHFRIRNKQISKYLTIFQKQNQKQQ